MNGNLIHQQSNWFDQRLADGGPVYAETNLHHFIVEPWNAVSSLLIILPAVYWFFRIRKTWRSYEFMLFIIPLMILGGTGSTLFHAFRASRFFLFMDFLPEAVLTLALSIYLWIKVFRRWWYVFFVIVPTLFVRFFLFGKLPAHMAINLSYTITGIIAGLPIVILQFKTGFYKKGYVIGAILFFIAAILFRELDTYPFKWLPMGTHFLWHAFSGAGAWFILAYLYAFRNLEFSEGNDKKADFKF